MTNIIKISTVVSVLAIAVFAFYAFSTTALAVAPGAGDGGCCGSTPSTPKPTTPTPNHSNPPVVPVCTLTATPAKIFAGESTQLSWTSQNAKTGTINHGIGDVSPKNVDGRRSVSPTVETTYTLTVTAENGKTAKCSTTVKIKPVVIDYPPVCTLKATPVWINKGEASTLSWTSQYATGGTIDHNVGGVDPTNTNGTRSVSPTVDTTYTLTVTSATGKTAHCSAVVKIKAVQEVIPACTLSANPTWINKGGASTLSWTSHNAVSGSIDNGVGGVTPTNTDGTRSVSPTSDTTYTMTVVSSTGNTAHCSAPVKIKQPEHKVVTCDLFNIDKSVVEKGELFTISWNTTNAENVSINNGIGSVSADGSLSTSVQEGKTFTLTATRGNQSVNCADSVSIKHHETPIVSCDLFNIDKSEVERGESFVISWNTTNADSVSINNGVGNVNADGSHTTSVQDSTTFTLTAVRGSQSVNCSDSVSVKTSNGGGGGSSSPKCELKISDKNISKGQEVKLSWDTSRATEVTIKDSFGKTIIDTDDLDKDDKKDFYDGEIKVRPTKDTTYTLVAEKGSKDRTCKVSVDVDSDITVLEIRDQKPLVGGISLTQVPYTGFDAGPTLTLIFYGLLALWGAFIAYAVVLKKKNS